MSREDDATRLDEIGQEIRNLMEEAYDITSNHFPWNTVQSENAYRGWRYHIEVALSRENSWIGQCACSTLEETAMAIRDLPEEAEEK